MEKIKVISKILTVITGFFIILWGISEVFCISEVTSTNQVKSLKDFYQSDFERLQFFKQTNRISPKILVVQTLEKTLLALPSGSPAYLFESNGNLLDFTHDLGEDDQFKEKWNIQAFAKSKMIINELGRPVIKMDIGSYSIPLKLSNEKKMILQYYIIYELHKEDFSTAELRTIEDKIKHSFLKLEKENFIAAEMNDEEDDAFAYRLKKIVANIVSQEKNKVRQNIKVVKVGVSGLDYKQLND